MSISIIIIHPRMVEEVLCIGSLIGVVVQHLHDEVPGLIRYADWNSFLLIILDLRREHIVSLHDLGIELLLSWCPEGRSPIE